MSKRFNGLSQATAEDGFMEAKPRHLLVGAAVGVLATLLLMVLVAAVVAYSGGYNVAASSGHSAGVRWLFQTTMQASVRSRAGSDGGSPLAGGNVAAGAHEFKAMCEHCHGGAGVGPAEWSRGMLPRPPKLTEAAADWKQQELFWIIQHGIKDTGMPSFGETHDEATLGNIAAFVHRLPGMTPEQYQAYGPAEETAHGSNLHRDGKTDTGH
jgi:mono/diheme cytochrome c family protein